MCSKDAYTQWSALVASLSPSRALEMTSNSWGFVRPIRRDLLPVRTTSTTKKIVLSSVIAIAIAVVCVDTKHALANVDTKVNVNPSGTCILW